MAETKRVRIFAGPNGSGKSTLKDIVEEYVYLGIYVNADDILRSMRESSRLNFSEFGLVVDEKEFEAEYEKWPIQTNRDLWTYENNGITVKDKNQIEDYFVSFLADYIRNALLLVSKRFSFETVMSHPSKLDFMRRARSAGFKVYLYFVSLPDPELNVYRVQARVSKGGHDVDPEKIVSRYYRTMNYLYDAIRLADSVFLFDNKSSKPQLFAKKENGELKVEGTYVPQWYQTYVLDKLKDGSKH